MNNKTLAEQLLFQLQFMGMMLMVGRQEEADTAYQKALALAKELIAAGH
jgi:predicted RNA polymerase sigma factor